MGITDFTNKEGVMKGNFTCPICGNETKVNKKLDKQKCKLCNEWFQVSIITKGKKQYVELKDLQ